MRVCVVVMLVLVVGLVTAHPLLQSSRAKRNIDAADSVNGIERSKWQMVRETVQGVTHYVRVREEWVVVGEWNIDAADSVNGNGGPRGKRNIDAADFDNFASSGESQSSNSNSNGMRHDFKGEEVREKVQGVRRGWNIDAADSVNGIDGPNGKWNIDAADSVNGIDGPSGKW
ncbi:hypothetical protein Pmani_038967 [Petrolisthes manimaculis]|uniref:Uncharacterized protein n=1 Tax=Petrolisthes manimaculis TaxID=1843537 RepID=A0AAE1TK05_9EUCA|nr:hypothetical protein Pmani_038967 [Petrolisthes manimaculis]